MFVLIGKFYQPPRVTTNSFGLEQFFCGAITLKFFAASDSSPAAKLYPSSHKQDNTVVFNYTLTFSPRRALLLTNIGPPSCAFLGRILYSISHTSNED
jgi:hypothetical protein